MGCPRHLRWSPIKEESVAEESVEPNRGISPRGGLKGKRQRYKGGAPVFGGVSFLVHSLFFLGFSIQKIFLQFCLGGRMDCCYESSFFSSPALLCLLHALSSIVLSISKSSPATPFPSLTCLHSIPFFSKISCPAPPLEISSSPRIL